MESFSHILFANMFSFGSEIHLKHILKTGRLMDQSSSHNLIVPPDISIGYIFAQIIAERFNLSLITNGHSAALKLTNQKYSCGKLNVTRFPQFIYPVQTFGGLVPSLHLWNCFRNPPHELGKTKKLPVFVQKETPLFNSLTVPNPKKKYESNWNFKIFTDPFDLWTWLVLTVTLVLLSTVVSISTSHGFFITFLSSVAALLDNEIRQFTDSKLYVIWLFTTLLIVDFYSGEITSQVIAPPEESYLTRFSDLQKNNYSIIFPHKGTLNAFNTSVRIMSKLPETSETTKALRSLLLTSKVIRRTVGNSFSESLTGNGKIAAVAGSPYTVWYAMTGSKFILTGKSGKLGNKRCHVGKDLINIVGKRFLVFTPPGSIPMGRAFQKFFASGIIPRWDQEGIWLLSAKRVQDRTQVISTTSIATESTMVKSLSMQGKILTIFLLWALCLVMCCLSLTYEIAMIRWPICRKSKIHIINKINP